MKNNRLPANATQVRRVIDSLANGMSIRQAAEKHSLSKSVIEKIKAGTYHVKPEANKYAERRAGQKLKSKRTTTALPTDYRSDEVAAQTALRKELKRQQIELNERLARHPFPDASRLLDECRYDIEWIERIVLEVALKDKPSKDLIDPFANALHQLITLKRLYPAGFSDEMNQFGDLVWTAYFALSEAGLITEDTTEEDLQNLNLLGDIAPAQYKPRHHARARAQLKQWCHLEAKTNHRPLMLLSGQHGHRQLIDTQHSEVHIDGPAIDTDDIRKEDLWAPPPDRPRTGPVKRPGYRMQHFTSDYLASYAGQVYLGLIRRGLITTKRGHPCTAEIDCWTGDLSD
jgi:transposase